MAALDARRSPRRQVSHAAQLGNHPFIRPPCPAAADPRIKRKRPSERTTRLTVCAESTAGVNTPCWS
jgi:hypothetical protein